MKVNLSNSEPPKTNITIRDMEVGKVYKGNHGHFYIIPLPGEVGSVKNRVYLRMNQPADEGWTAMFMKEADDRGDGLSPAIDGYVQVEGYIDLTVNIPSMK